MFDTLIESKPRKQKTAGQTVFSLIIHGLLIAGAIKVTAGAAERVDEMLADTTMVFLTPPEATPPPPEPPPEDVVVSANPPPKGFQTIVAPQEIPTEIPPVNLSERALDPRDFTGKGVEGGIAAGVVGGTGGGGKVLVSMGAALGGCVAVKATRMVSRRGRLQQLSATITSSRYTLPLVSAHSGKHSVALRVSRALSDESDKRR